MNDSINEYSKIKYVNKLNDLDSIKHGEKILYVTFIKSSEDKNKENNILHELTICRVVKTGQIIHEDQNINGCFSINIDYKIRTSGHLSKRINANTFISGRFNERLKYNKIYKNQLINGDALILKKSMMKNYTSTTHNNLNKHIKSITSNNLVRYTVRVPDDDLLNEIEDYNKYPSLFQLCVCVLSSKDLEKYNQLYQNFIL